MQHAIHTMLPDTYEISHFHLLTHIVMKDDNNIDEKEEEKEEKTILMGEPVSYTQKTTFVTFAQSLSSGGDTVYSKFTALNGE